MTTNQENLDNQMAKDIIDGLDRVTHQENYGLDIQYKAVKYGTTDLQQIEAIDRLLAEARKEERSLANLIEKCGEEFESLHFYDGKWFANSRGELRPDLDDEEHKGTRCESGCCGKVGEGLTPEEAVKNLLTKLNQNE